MNHNEIEDLLMNGRDGPAQVAHAGEVAALAESLGYTDRSAKEWGFPDVFALAEHLFARLQQDPAPGERGGKNDGPLGLWVETRYVICKFSLSSAYAIPWMAMLTLECLRPNALQVSPEIGGALSLSLIASLIMAGGLVQMISRSGNFYYGLKEPVLARRTCMSLLNGGITMSLFSALLGMLLGSYFHLFVGKYLVLAGVDYVAMSLLWMLCAVLFVQGIGWCIPFIFLFSVLISGLLKILTNSGTINLLIFWPLLAVGCAASAALVAFYRLEQKDKGKRESSSPRFGVLLISLVPFYIYGTVYFSFLFADRLTAGSAVSWASGLSFGIDAAYEKGTDLVLLAFLVTAALVESLGDSFLRHWQRLACELPQAANQQLMLSLRRRHLQTIIVICTAFVVISLGAWYGFSRLSSSAPAPRVLQTALLCGFGYLMLSVALLETIILVSVNAIARAILAMALGVGVNLLTGYGLSHLWGVQYAGVGLLAGSAVVLWKCNAAVRQVLSRCAYHYSIS